MVYLDSLEIISGDLLVWTGVGEVVVGAGLNSNFVVVFSAATAVIPAVVIGSGFAIFTFFIITIIVTTVVGTLCVFGAVVGGPAATTITNATVIVEVGFVSVVVATIITIATIFIFLSSKAALGTATDSVSFVVITNITCTCTVTSVANTLGYARVMLCGRDLGP